MIDEHEWRSVLQVAKDGTFSAAAKHLYISQPSLSQCIKKVETELGVRLFDRSQTPLALTPAGTIYVRQAKEILRIQQSLVQEVADLSELRTGSLTIGSSRTRTACFLIDPLVAFHRQYPGIQLAIKEAPVRTLEDYVASGTVDFALLYGSSLRPGFTSVALCREHTMLAVPKAHPPSARASSCGGQGAGLPAHLVCCYVGRALHPPAADASDGGGLREALRVFGRKAAGDL